MENDIYIPSYNDKILEDDDIGIDHHDHKHDNHKHYVKGRKCYGLALSESHNIGPYQAGVIQGLIKELKNTGHVDYDVISGISLGAFNAIILSTTKKGHEVDAIQKLEDFWYALADRNDYLI